MTNGQIVTKGTVGVTASLGAWYLSHVAQINAVLQTASLVVGIAIGLVSLVKLVRKKQKNKHHEN